MKLLFVSPRPALMFRAVLFTVTLLAGYHALAHVKEEGDFKPLPNLDLRSVLPVSSQKTVEQKQAVANLQQKVPGVTVSFDPFLQAPKFIRAQTGFLTGANGSGLAVSSQAIAAYPDSDVFRGVKAFLDEQAALFGHGGAVLNDAIITRDGVGAHNGLRTVVWQQQLDGVPVFEAVMIANVTGQGQIASLAGGFLPDAATAASAGMPNRVNLQAQPLVSAQQAISLAAQSLGDTIAPGEIDFSGDVVGIGFQKFSAHQWSAHARQVWLPINRDNLRLHWEVIVRSQVSRRLYQVLVDVETGVVTLRRNLTRNISDATYNVYTSDSPSPFSPGHPNPSAVQPPLVNRTLVTLSALDTTASPNGWINDGDNETRGNNTDTFVDRDFDGQPDGGARVQGNPARVFDFPLDLTQAPLTYSNAAAVQMFYWVNWYHDRLYQLGFTESFGNYQNNNFGRGGFGGDEIISFVQAGADLGAANNAFFSPAPDGISGEIAMFVWDFPTPNRDGDLDAEIIIHEATHGLSWRLVGGGVGLGNLQSDGMGEGWSDFYALSLLSQPGDDPDAVYAAGGYVTYQFAGLGANYYFGVRHFPYTTDMSKNPFTFKDIDPGQISSHPGVPRSPIYPFNPAEADEVHHQGEVWCVTLWEVRANLIRKHGASANELMLQLVTDGMKLGPANPNFLEARDAILLADQVNNGGANYLEIWRGFAKRGMGFTATSPASTTTVGVREAFDVPGLQISGSFVAGGNGNGVIDPNECNDLYITLTNLTLAGISNVQVTVSTTNAGVAFGVRTTAYPDMPSGSGGVNLSPFTLSTAPFFVCGTPIHLDVQIKSDQVTSRVAFTLNTGTMGAPVRFDNVIPVFIPDENPIGTNSLITVSNITSAIYKVNVSLFLTHTWDSDLSLELISPDGTSVLLSQANGGSGDNYGASCSPDLFRTTFDDDSTAPITGGSAPFVGTFRPQATLSAFVGMVGTNVNGTWKLRLVDSVGFDVGTLQCWSLFLYPATCTDGGGTCPGADLSIKLNDAPDPVFLGSNLVYTLTVSNSGPSEAKNVIVNHQLPASVVFASASSSQGNVTHSGGVVVANVGTLPLAGSATIVVNVIPTLTGSFTSTASVTSAEPDPDSANNFASTGTQILPPSADLAVGLHDSPDPALVGGMVAYTVSITNNGPSTASGVMVTNVLPISFVVQSAVPAQGTASINGNIVIFNFGTLTNGGRTTGVIHASPTATGSFMATAAARANQADPVPANNTATATTVVGPAADLALTLSANPNTVVVSSNWTYTVTVTNNGPSTANGIIVTHNLPAGVNVVNTSTTSGSVVAGGGVATTTISSLASGGGAVIQVVVNSGSTNTYNSSATVTGAEADGNLANNSANVSTLVAAPFLSIEAVSATLTAESITPADGAMSVGETVTAEFRLRNTGNVSNTNLTATLLAVNGVTAPVPATEVNYGVLPAGGLPVGRSFSFTATGTNGGAVVATLQLRDNGSIIGNVTFNFTLPTIFTFANTNNISITDNQTTPWPAGPAAPYPSTISVSGVTGLVGKVTVTLSNLNHTYPDDIDMLLVGPGGQKVVLMSDAGGAFGLINATVTFDDAAAVIPDASQILATSYHPANYGAGDPFNSPAPGGPYDTNLASFAGANPNGTWSLFIMDDATGDKGNIANGWSLAFTAITPVNQVADLIVSAGATPDPVLVGASLTTSFTISNAGPNTATGVAFTNTLPAGVSLLAASASQGSVSTNSSSVVVNLGSLAAGNAAQVAVVVMPGLGALTNSTTGFVASTASVVISDTDLNPANNTATAQAVVNVPVADLALWQSIPANQVTIGSNITFTVAVTNQGPQTALSTVVTNWLPAGLNFVSTTAATFTNASGQITVSLGDLPVGAGSSFTVTATATTAGNRTNITTAVSPSSDPVAANNTASTAFTVLPLTPSIVASSARITQESGVFNGAVDLAETVTVSLSLQNVGSISTVNLRATLQAAGGVSAPSGPQSYGVLTAGGATVARPFTFTAPNTSGGTVTATLALKDERPGVTNDLGTVAFVFQLPGSTTFSNTVSIVIPEAGPASPYPSTITVSGVPGVVSRASVTLQGLVHKFPDDVDVLLVGPAGQKVLLLSDAGGGYAVTNRTITIADGNPAVPDTTEIFSGSYQPSNYESEADNFPAVAGGNPAGALSSYTGSAPNGNWSLYVVDDAAGDGGTIVGGWSLTLETISPVNPIADLQVTLSAAPDVGAPNPPFVGSALIYTLSITNLGPATASNVVVSDSLPGNLAYQSSTTTLGTLLNNSGNLTWTVGALAAGSGATASIRTAASNGGAAVNQATAVGDETDLNPGNSTAQVSTTIRVPTLVTFSELSLTNAQLQFTLTGDAGMSYRILASTNLSTWTVLATNTAAANGTIKFVDAGVPGFGQRFYRAERLIP